MTHSLIAVVLRLAYVEANRQYAELVKEQYMEGDVIWIQVNIEPRCSC